MTRAPLVLVAVPCLAFADAGLHAALLRADAVVVAKVERVEGQTAHLAVQRVLKGQAPATLALPKDTQVGCFADQAFFSAEAVVVPVSRTERVLRDQYRGMIARGETKPGAETDLEALAKEAGERQPWIVDDDVLRVETGELSRVVAAVEQGLALPEPTEAWGIALLKLRTTHASGVEFFEQPGRNIPAEARAIEAQALLSRKVHLWFLGRVLRWVAPIDDAGLTRAAMDVVRSQIHRPPPGLRVEEAVTLIARRLDPKAADPVIPAGQEGWDAPALVRAKARFAQLEEQLKATSRGR